MGRSALGIAALVVGCAGSPVEAGTAGGTADGTAGETSGAATIGTTTPGATSPDGTAGGTTGDGTTNPAATTDDPTGAATLDTGGTAGSSTDAEGGSTQAGSSGSDEGDTRTDTNDEGDSEGAAGGCLGDPLPEVAPAACSLNSAAEVDLFIENDCDYSIEVFWVNYQCGEQSYQVISGGNSWSTTSFSTHPWRIRNQSTGDLIVEIPALAGNTNVVVE